MVNLTPWGGGSINHSRIAVHLTTLIDTHLDSSQCFTGNSDLRINIVGTDNTNFRYVCYTSTLGEGAPLAVRPYGHLWHEF
jgi:hypothetical protein